MDIWVCTRHACAYIPEKNAAKGKRQRKRSMWLTPEQEYLIDKIGTKNQLTQEELAAIKNYQKFKQLLSLNPAHTGLGPGGIFPLEDILKKYTEI
jgi:hypothetical protein